MTQISGAQAAAVLTSFNTAFAVAEASLTAAAANVYDDMVPFWSASQTKATLTTFYTALLTTFPQDVPGGQPCANWIAVIAGLTDKISVPIPNLVDFTALVQAVYRLLWLTDYLSNN